MTSKAVPSFEEVMLETIRGSGQGKALIVYTIAALENISENLDRYSQDNIEYRTGED